VNWALDLMVIKYCIRVLQPLLICYIIYSKLSFSRKYRKYRKYDTFDIYSIFDIVENIMIFSNPAT